MSTSSDEAVLPIALAKIPLGTSLYTEMSTVFLYPNDTSSNRRILYAISKDNLLWIPAAIRLVVIPNRDIGWFHNHVQPFIPVWYYSGWAQSKCDDTKFKTCHGILDLASVIPGHYWR